jgi:hypothetical protein
MYRKRHQVANLVWDDAIAASAAKWVAGCPQGHSGYAGLGENMAWASSRTVEGMVDMWYDEVSLWGIGIIQNSDLLAEGLGSNTLLFRGGYVSIIYASNNDHHIAFSSLYHCTCYLAQV